MGLFHSRLWVVTAWKAQELLMTLKMPQFHSSISMSYSMKEATVSRLWKKGVKMNQAIINAFLYIYFLFTPFTTPILLWRKLFPSYMTSLSLPLISSATPYLYLPISTNSLPVFHYNACPWATAWFYLCFRTWFLTACLLLSSQNTYINSDKAHYLQPN